MEDQPTVERAGVVPRISFFYGITIAMFWNERDHPVPHFHAEYGGSDASLELDGNVIVWFALEPSAAARPGMGRAASRRTAGELGARTPTRATPSHRAALRNICLDA